LQFECNQGFRGDFPKQAGDIWLYVSPKEKRLKIMKEGFLPLEYYISEAIEPSTVYILELVNKFQTLIKSGASLGFILIKSDPPGAEVKVNGDPTGSSTPFQKPLNPGRYSYELTTQLYLPYSGTFVINAGKTTIIENMLEPNFGTLSIQSQPEDSAAIYLDDRLLKQKTPIVIEQLASGQHSVVLRKEMYETVEQNFEIQNGQTTTLNVVLQPTFGEVEITVPGGVEIWVDQERVGFGDYSGRLLKGIHLIEGKKLNHYDFSETVTIELGQKHQVIVTMSPITGILTIMTEPPEADIFLDGVNKGKSPLIIENLIIGSHTIRLAKDGHGEVSKQISLQENQTLDVYETLPSALVVRVTSSPTGAYLSIDGKMKGLTPSTETVTFGRHTVEISKEGYKKTNRTISIDGKRTSFDFSLEKLPPVTGTFTDPRDNHPYKWVRIGEQVWMAENLNYKTNDSRCYKRFYNCSTYGRLYSSADAKKACPSGWHLPSYDEWGQLIEFLGGKDIAGGKMKEIGDANWKRINRGATNSSDFSAIPGGFSYDNGEFKGLGDKGYFWSSTEESPNRTWNLVLSKDQPNVIWYYYSAGNKFSVRCIRDN